MDWDWLRRRLNLPYQAGCWFLLSEADIAFAPRKVGMRPVILAKAPGTGPQTYGYARTTTGGEGIPHPPHPRDDTHPDCGIDQQGWIVTSIPLALNRTLINQDSFMCSEPFEEILEKIVGII